MPESRRSSWNDPVSFAAPHMNVKCLKMLQVSKQDWGPQVSGVDTPCSQLYTSLSVQCQSESHYLQPIPLPYSARYEDTDRQ